jgi:hypothetical protein
VAGLRGRGEAAESPAAGGQEDNRWARYEIGECEETVVVGRLMVDLAAIAGAVKDGGGEEASCL